MSSDGNEAPADSELAESLRGGFRSREADVNGVRLHYVIGGAGTPLVLLPGWPETWWEYRKIMPALAERYRVIAVDLRGMGGSSRPYSGFDKKNMARDVYELVRILGYDSINIAGHGIGSMVAFSFAANHADATKKVALLNTTHIDDSYYEFRIMPRSDDPGPHRWWLGFNLVPEFPEQVLAGRYRYMIDYMFGLSLLDPDAITSFDRDVYARAYSDRESIRTSKSWFRAYHEDIADFNGYGKVTAPMLGIAYGPFFEYMEEHLPDQGTDVLVTEISDTRNYMAEEQPAAVADSLCGFFC